MNDSEDEVARLQSSIAALEAQRSLLGDAVVDTALEPMREKVAALQGTLLTEQQRKQVTILFADVVGFTSMSETMDAEDVTAILNRVWQRLDDVIVEHGGHIDKHIGDAVMALWGTEAAREDDPEQAVRAALAMQEQVAVLVGVDKDSDQQIALRIGISTGPVLLGEVGATREFTAIGDPVNVASRLQHYCPVGSVVISHETYRHVRGLFDLRALEPVTLKGKAEPARLYLVERAKHRAFRMMTRGIEGLETRMIGRDSQLKSLQDAFYVANQDRVLTAVTIVGEPGIGKSRLLYEFDKWAELQPVNVQLFHGRGRQETSREPYTIWRELFALQFDIHDNDPLSLVRSKITAGLEEMLVVHDQLNRRVDVLGQLLGYDFARSASFERNGQDARQLQEKGVAYLADYFKAAAANKLAVLLIEDLHWGDDSSLDVLAQLCQIMRVTPLLIIASARPSLYERRPNWFEGRSFHTQLDLQPLSRSDSRLLIEEILRKVDRLPETFRELIAGNSEGNPFYAEELIKMLIEQEVIVAGTNPWKLYPERLDTIFVPPTLTGVLQARLDALSPVERTVIQQASVVGRIFWDESLFYINQDGPEELDNAAITSALKALRSRELIYLHDLPTFGDAEEYTFKHALLRDVAYESVLKSKRGHYHGLVASWLIDHMSESVAKVSGIAADHFLHAGETNMARRYFIQAAHGAERNYANREAVGYYTQALELLGHDDLALHWKLLLAREQLYLLLGDAAETASDLEKLKKLVAREDNPHWKTVLRLRQASHFHLTGDYPAAIKSAEEAKRLAQAAGLEDQLAEANVILGRVYWSQGEFHASVVHQAEALEIYREFGDRHAEAVALLEYGGSIWTDGDHAAGVDYTARALEVARETGNRLVEGLALNNLGYASWAYGDYDQAVKYLEAALSVKQEIGARRYMSESLKILSRVALLQNNPVRALELAEAAKRIDEEIEGMGDLGIGLDHLANAYASLGRLEEAEEHYRQAIAISEVHGRTERAMRTRASWARMALGQGNIDRARRLVDEILDFLDQGHRLYGAIEPMATLAACIRVLQALGDPRANSMLDETYASLIDLAEQMPEGARRRMFIDNVPWHQEIIRMWRAARSA